MKENSKLLIISAILGFGIGVMSVLFLGMVKVATHYAWQFIPWAPVLGIIAGLCVGFVVKYFGQLKGIGFEAVAADVKKTGEVRPIIIPQVVLNAFFGLISGASIGPEAPLMALGGFCGSWVARRLKLAEEQLAAFTAIALGTSLGTLLESPIAGALFMVENPAKKLQKDRRALYTLMFASFVAACVGFGVFILVMGQYITSLHLIPPYSKFAFIDLLYCLILGIVGSFLGIFVTKAVERAQEFGGRFSRWPIPRAIIAGFLVGCIGLFLPLVLFSGQDEMPAIINNPASYTILMLCVLIVAKIVVTAISFGGGYQGGNIFPTLFISGVSGVLVNTLFPFIPLPIAMAGMMGGMLFASFKLPLFSIFLLIIMSETNLLPFITISVAGGMFVQLSTQKPQVLSHE